MIVSTDFLAGVLTNFRTIAMMSMADAEKRAEWPKIAVRMRSVGADQETYNWLSAVPGMQEWVDERAIHGLTGFDYTIKNKHFESTIGVEKNALADDKLGMIRPRLQDLGRRAALFPDELVFDLLNRGAAVNAFDGTAYFADTRVFGDSGNIDNLLAGAGITEEDIRTDLAAAITAIGRFRDNRGKPLNLISGPAPVTIVCPLDLVIRIRGALLPAVAGTERVETGFVKEVIGSAFLTDVNDWYVLATNQVLKPLIFQTRQAPEFVALDQATSSEVFMRKHLYYGIDMRCNVGFTDPRYAVKIVNI